MVGAADTQLRKREFWSVENLKYSEPHFRLHKLARIVNRLACRRIVDLLDVGCGPCALAPLLDANVRYHGIDIAIQKPAANLLESDFVEGQIAFEGAKFDIIVASGVFEYVGATQAKKFEEIRSILKRDGRFVLSYLNFDHIHGEIYQWLYNNVQPLSAFRQDLAAWFEITRTIPVSYNWRGTTPRRRLLRKVELHFNLNVPVVGRLLAVEYLYVCAPRTGRM